MMFQARTTTTRVRGTGDLFAAGHPFHTSICQYCKGIMERKWLNPESSWTAGLEKIDLVSEKFCIQV